MHRITSVFLSVESTVSEHVSIQHTQKTGTMTHVDERKKEVS